MDESYADVKQSPGNQSTSNKRREPLEYLAAHLAEALACDPRVNELGLQVAVRGTKLYISGSVQTDERQAAIGAVAAEVADGYEVHNQTTVVAFHDLDGVETLS